MSPGEGEGLRGRMLVDPDPAPREAGPPRRLLLFDIDGTLVTGGPAKAAFRHAMSRVYGLPADIDEHDFAGKTDPQIARELLRKQGLEDGEIDAGMPGLWEGYLVELRRRLDDEPMRRLPGVGVLLDALADRSGEAALGLLTGNILQGAMLKLRSVSLDGRFEVGAFGSDAEVRDVLPGVALRRATARWGTSYSRAEVVVVGDTPRDVAAGRAHGLRTVAVSTGRHGVRELEEAGAGTVVRDFRDTGAALEALLG